MLSIQYPKRKRRLIALSAATLTLSSGSVIAYRHFFHRAGEQAIALIPADALMVFTLDTNPSPAQVTLFNQLRSTYRLSGLAAGIEELFADNEGKPNALGALRPFLTDNYAMAWLGKLDVNTKETPEMAFFISISDRNGVENWLKENATATKASGLDYYKIKDIESVAMVQEGYLVLAPQVSSLQKIAEVAAHRVPSLETSNDYREARASLDTDANFMGFISPQVYQSLGQSMKELNAKSGSNKLLTSYSDSSFDIFHSLSWVAMGATVRAEGLQINYVAPIDASKDAFWKALAQVKPLDANALKALPTGSYLVYSLAQPSVMLDAMREIGSRNPDAKKEIDKGIADFEKEIGLSVKDDILPAFQGPTTLALYPDEANPDGYVDGVVYISDENNGDPATLSDKIRAMIEKKSAEKGKTPVRFTTTQVGNVTEVALDAKSANRMRNSIIDTIEPQPAQYQPPTPRLRSAPKHANPAGKSKSAKLRTASYLDSTTEVKHARGGYVKGKTIVWAIVGRSVILATSQPMLDKALASAEGRAPSIATDPNNVPLQSALAKGTQAWSWIGVGQIMQRIRPYIEDGFKEDRQSADNLINLFGGKDAGLFAMGKYDGKLSTGTLFYPLDWERALQLGGTFSRKMNEGKPHTTRKGSFWREMGLPIR